MSTEKPKDGGPAFPYVETGACGVRPGMTLRDYFAAKSLLGLIGVGAPGTSLGVHHPDMNLNFARAAYAIADAMLVAREVKP